jgi:hypothetical protein
VRLDDWMTASQHHSTCCQQAACYTTFTPGSPARGEDLLVRLAVGYARDCRAGSGGAVEAAAGVSIYLVSHLRSAIMAIPYTGLFIAASCNSRSSHGQVRNSYSVRPHYWDRIVGTSLIRLVITSFTHTPPKQPWMFFSPDRPSRSTRPTDPRMCLRLPASVNEGVSVTPEG